MVAGLGICIVPVPLNCYTVWWNCGLWGKVLVGKKGLEVGGSEFTHLSLPALPLSVHAVSEGNTF